MALYFLFIDTHHQSKQHSDDNFINHLADIMHGHFGPTYTGLPAGSSIMQCLKLYHRQYIATNRRKYAFVVKFAQCMGKRMLCMARNEATAHCVQLN